MTTFGKGTRGISADNADPNRTHAAVTKFARYGTEGHVERGMEILMREAQVSLAHCTPSVQAIGVFRDVIAALRAAGIDPAGPWQTALVHRDGLEEDGR